MQLTTVSIVVALIACISPLLTFAYLWQLKEWRIDRLREHMRSEGWFTQLFGQIRPIILLFGWLMIGITSLYVFMEMNVQPFKIVNQISIGIISLIALLNTIQFALKKQPKPVWTAKAILLVVLSILIDTGILTCILINNKDLGALSSTIIILLQPAVIFASWTLLNPVDLFAKQRIRNCATTIRNKHKNLTVIGITGSVGKTTTKELLNHILLDKKMIATPNYVNSDIGVARWLTKVLKNDDIPEILIVEMGAYRNGEIASLCIMAQPNIGIITAIGSQHIALFGSKEALCKAKGELVEAIPNEGKVYLNTDSAPCISLIEKAKCSVIKIGTGGHADLEAYDIEETNKGIKFKIGETNYFVPLHGTHNVTNVLLSIAVAKDLGIKDENIIKQLQTFSPPLQTFSVTEKNGIKILNDTHNASISSFRAAIAWAKTQPMENKILLTNGFMELGALQDNMHTEIGALSKDVFSRVIFLHKRNSQSFQKGFNKPVKSYSKEYTPLKSGDLLVCIGKVPKSSINQLISSN